MGSSFCPFGVLVRLTHFISLSEDKFFRSGICITTSGTVEFRVILAVVLVFLDGGLDRPVLVFLDGGGDRPILVLLDGVVDRLVLLEDMETLSKF